MENGKVDILIIGGGVMGCATAYQLAKDGQSVILLEQYSIGNRMGSSHGASRLFRLAHDRTFYVELAKAASTFWRELEDDAGTHLLQPVDALDLGPAQLLEDFRTALQSAAVPFELLDGAEIMRRFPQFTLPAGTLGLYQDNYALLAADRCVNAFAALARRYGASLLEGEAVQQIHPAAGGVEVHTGRNIYRAGAAVLSAGSWMKPLLQQLGIDLPLSIRKEHITFYQPADPSLWMPGRFPLFRHHLGGMNGRWGVGFPIFEHRGVKMLVDCTGPFVEPDDPDRSVDPSVVDLVRQYTASIVPGIGNNLITAETCRYTMTPDDDFILDRHPSYPQIVIASPCSGHGFKFAPLIGRILADLATRGATQYDIQRFRLDRPGLSQG